MRSTYFMLLWLLALSCTSAQRDTSDSECRAPTPTWSWVTDPPVGEWEGTFTRGDGTEGALRLYVSPEYLANDLVTAGFVDYYDLSLAVISLDDDVVFQGLYMRCFRDAGCLYKPSEYYVPDPNDYPLSQSVPYNGVVLLADTVDGTCADAEETQGLWAIHATGVFDQGALRIEGDAEIGAGCGDALPHTTGSWTLSYRGHRVPIEDPTDTGSPPGDDDDDDDFVLPVLDEDALLAVAASYEPYVHDLSLLTDELTVDDQGCTVRRWQVPRAGYFYRWETEHGLGILLHDISQPIDETTEDGPRYLMLHADQHGAYQVAGLGWFLGLPNNQWIKPTPELFGVPMKGPNLLWPEDPHHYFLHAWPWIASPDNRFGLLNMFNEGMRVPEWFYDFEPSLYELMALGDSAYAHAEGYLPAGGCVSGPDGDAGHPLVRQDLVGLVDPTRPDTVLVDGAGETLGVQWTWPDDGTGAPALFQQAFTGPDADGNYVLRAWIGTRFNHGGYFHPTHAGFACDEPPLTCP